MSADLPSIGSLGHADGGCKGLCRHFVKQQCHNGLHCKFCHMQGCTQQRANHPKDDLQQKTVAIVNFALEHIPSLDFTAFGQHEQIRDPDDRALVEVTEVLAGCIHKPNATKPGLVLPHVGALDSSAWAWAWLVVEKILLFFPGGSHLLHRSQKSQVPRASQLESEEAAADCNFKAVLTSLLQGSKPALQAESIFSRRQPKFTPHALSDKHFLFPTDRTSCFFPDALHKPIDHFAWRLSLHLLSKYWPSHLPVAGATLKVNQTLLVGKALISTNGQYSLSLSGGSLAIVKLVADHKGWQTLWELAAEGGIEDLHCVQLCASGQLVARDSQGNALWQYPLSHSVISDTAALLLRSDGNLVLLNGCVELWSAGCQQPTSCHGLHHRRWPIMGLLLKYNQLLFNLAEREYRVQQSERVMFVTMRRTFVDCDVSATSSKIERSRSW